MRLTKKKAIEYSIELWDWLAKTGKEKDEWPEWKKYGEVQDNCFLCEYDGDAGCSKCPLGKMYLGCVHTYFADWCRAKTKQSNKKYAKLFLEQLKQLLGDKKDEK